MLISQASIYDIKEVKEALEKNLDNAKTLEEAGKIFVNQIYDKFKESIVLLRLFVTIQMEDLPKENQTFVNNLARSVNLPTPVDANSSILSLIGTIGVNPAWNNRKNSRGHLGIPLVTADFVSAVPMLSALLEQLGFDLGWIRGDPEIVARKIGRMGGTFYVPDASSTLDTKGRKIIAAQDFVSHYDVKAVFGFGGGYTAGTNFVAAICFTKDSFDKSTAIHFQGLINVFKLKTISLVRDKTKHFNK